MTDAEEMRARAVAVCRDLAKAEHNRAASERYWTGRSGGYEDAARTYEHAATAIAALPLTGGWLSIDDAPLAVWGQVWHPLWRRPFPGMRNGDHGAVWIDTCESEARGRQDYATHWCPEQPLPAGPELVAGNSGEQP